MAHFVHSVLLLHALPFDQPEPTSSVAPEWGSSDEGPELVEVTSSEEGTDQSELVEVTESEEELIEVPSDELL